MKKMMFTLITGLMVVVLAACGGNEESKEAKNNDKAKTAETDQQKEQQKELEEMQKKLEAQKIDEKKTVAIVNDKEVLGSDYNSALASAQGQMQQLPATPLTLSVPNKLLFPHPIITQVHKSSQDLTARLKQ